MAIDLKNLKPTKISRSLKGKYILIYGSPKTGKSSFASKLPRALFLAFENGTNALDNIMAQPILKWTEVKTVLRQLRDPEVRDKFDTIVVDTAAIAYMLCEQYICAQNGVQNISEIPWGGGYKQVEQEFQEVWREMSIMGLGIIFIAHEKNRVTNMRDENGETISAVAPDLPSKCYSIINSMVDIIGYLSVQMNADGSNTRYLYTRSTPTIFAGSRYKYIAPKIIFYNDGYKSLLDAINDAIDKQQKDDGALVTDEEYHMPVSEPTRPFSETMEEARSLWNDIIARYGDAGREKIRKVVVGIFKQDIPLAKATEEQQDLIELVIQDLKDIN